MDNQVYSMYIVHCTACKVQPMKYGWREKTHPKFLNFVWKCRTFYILYKAIDVFFFIFRFASNAVLFLNTFRPFEPLRCSQSFVYEVYSISKNKYFSQQCTVKLKHNCLKRNFIILHGFQSVWHREKPESMGNWALGKATVYTFTYNRVL